MRSDTDFYFYLSRFVDAVTLIAILTGVATVQQLKNATPGIRVLYVAGTLSLFALSIWTRRQRQVDSGHTPAKDNVRPSPPPPAYRRTRPLAEYVTWCTSFIVVTAVVFSRTSIDAADALPGFESSGIVVAGIVAVTLAMLVIPSLFGELSRNGIHGVGFGSFVFLILILPLILKACVDEVTHADAPIGFSTFRVLAGPLIAVGATILRDKWDRYGPRYLQPLDRAVPIELAVLIGKVLLVAFPVMILLATTRPWVWATAFGLVLFYLVAYERGEARF